MSSNYLTLSNLVLLLLHDMFWVATLLVKNLIHDLKSTCVTLPTKCPVLTSSHAIVSTWGGTIFLKSIHPHFFLVEQKLSMGTTKLKYPPQQYPHRIFSAFLSQNPTNVFGCKKNKKSGLIQKKKNKNKKIKILNCILVKPN